MPQVYLEQSPAEAFLGWKAHSGPVLRDSELLSLNVSSSQFCRPAPLKARLARLDWPSINPPGGLHTEDFTWAEGWLWSCKEGLETSPHTQASFSPLTICEHRQGIYCPVFKLLRAETELITCLSRKAVRRFKWDKIFIYLSSAHSFIQWYV